MAVKKMKSIFLIAIFLTIAIVPTSAQTSGRVRKMLRKAVGDLLSAGPASVPSSLEQSAAAGGGFFAHGSFHDRFVIDQLERAPCDLIVGT